MSSLRQTVAGRRLCRAGSGLGIGTDVPKRDVKAVRRPVAPVTEDRFVWTEPSSVETEARFGMVEPGVGRVGNFGAISWYNPGGRVGFV